MSDDRCQALSPLQDGKALWCTLPAGHTDDHYNGEYYWANTPQQCGATTNTGFSVIRCEQRAAHAGSHMTDQYSWPNVQPLQTKQHYTSNALQGVDRDNLIRDLFERIETLEQGTAGGAATDDMFAAQEQRIAQLEERVRGLERAQVYGSGQQDPSALQASIASHLSRALTDLGSGLDTRFTLLTEALRARGRNDEQRHIDTTAKLDAIWNVLAAMAPVIDALKPDSLRVICGTPDLSGLYHCDRDPGHNGRHRNGISTWPNPCGAAHPSLDAICARAKGHTTEHRGSFVHRLVRWGDQSTEHVTERASGSPAAVRCSTEFREGPCLGYAGHDGECSALPESDNPQLEDPEEFDECGMDPAPGHSMPPCGRPKGHDGPCVSGPSGENGDPFDGDESTPV